MKQLLELIPLIVFFGSYQKDGDTIHVGSWQYTFDGIYSATAALMISSVLVWLLASVASRRNEKRLMWMTIAILGFGAATLVLRDQRFIQWKPTVFNWALAALFTVSQFWSRRTILERTLGGQLSLPSRTWLHLNALWIGNFLVVGALNLLVAFKFSESFWVSYKLYSAIAFTLLLMVFTVVLIAPHLSKEESTSNTDGEVP